MLQAEERFMFKELYGRGVSISEIARRTGHDRKTVRAPVRSAARLLCQPAAALGRCPGREPQSGRPDSQV